MQTEEDFRRAGTGKSRHLLNQKATGWGPTWIPVLPLQPCWEPRRSRRVRMRQKRGKGQPEKLEKMARARPDGAECGYGSASSPLLYLTPALALVEDSWP